MKRDATVTVADHTLVEEYRHLRYVMGESDDTIARSLGYSKAEPMLNALKRLGVRTERAA